MKYTFLMAAVLAGSIGLGAAEASTVSATAQGPSVSTLGAGFVAKQTGPGINTSQGGWQIGLNVSKFHGGKDRWKEVIRPGRGGGIGGGSGGGSGVGSGGGAGAAAPVPVPAAGVLLLGGLAGLGALRGRRKKAA